jgi:hypothetical protein
MAQEMVDQGLGEGMVQAQLMARVGMRRRLES